MELTREYLCSRAREMGKRDVRVRMGAQRVLMCAGWWRVKVVRGVRKVEFTDQTPPHIKQKLSPGTALLAGVLANPSRPDGNC